MALIVTAEDTPDVRALITWLLNKAGHTVIETVDGRAAVDAIEETIPDLVITDGEMPHMTGQQLCEHIKSTPALRHIPMLIVSGSITPQELHAQGECFDGYLPKPFTPKKLIDAVEALIAA